MGDKVGMSDSTLLNMLGISPFTYGLVIQKVYDSGTVFDPAILDITDDDLKANCMAVAAVTDITFKEAEMMKEFLADPSKFASVAAAPAAGGAAEEKKEEKVEEPEEESDDDMGFGLFD